MEITGTRRLRFSDFVLDPADRRLSRRGAEVALQPKPFALLLHLVAERHRVVPREEILAHVWPDVVVSDAALLSALRDLRRVLGDDAQHPSYIETHRAHGYRFVHPVEETFEDGPRADTFVGRDALVRALGQQLDAAREGRGQVAFLMGEAGIGKTRTSFEVAALAGRLGLRVFLGRCLEEEGAPPYRPWVQILRDLIGARSPTSFDATLDPSLAAALLNLIGAKADLAASAAQTPASRFALFDAVVRVLAGAARERPLLLLLEDLHRADPSSLALLHHVVAEIPSLPLMILGTLRDAAPDANPAFVRTLETLQPAGTRWPLPGLSVEAVAALARLIGGSEPAASLAAALHERTGGNPLFVEEIARVLCASGAFDTADATLRVASLAPHGVVQVIHARISRLPAELRHALELASVVGREFEMVLLERVQPDAGDLRTALQSAVDAGIARAVAGRAATFRFTHILVRDALYDEIPMARRAALHAAIGHALETLDPLERDARADELAHHFEQALLAGGGPRAVHWARRAAERAIARAAYEEAEARAVRGLNAATVAFANLPGSKSGDATRARGELLVLLGRARWSRGATAEARAAFLAAIGAARSIGDADLFARAALGFTGRTDVTIGVNRAAVALLEEALALMPLGDGAARAEVLARLGTELYHDADPSRADVLTRDALAMAERLGEPDLLAYACSCRHFALLRVDVDPRARLPITERQIELAERSAPSEVLALGHQERVLDLLEMGDGARLERTLSSYEAVVQRLGQPFFHWFLGLYGGLRAFLAGDIETADRLAHETLAIGQSFGTPNAVAAFSAQLFGIRREQGRLAELEPPLRMLLAQQPDLPIHRTALAAIAAECGRREEATDAIVRLFESGTVDAFPRDEHFLTSMSLLAPACEIAGDPRWARRLYEILAPFAGRIIASGHGATCNGSVAYYLGRLAVALGDFDAADDHFADSRARLRQLGAPLWVAHTQAAHARALWKRGTPGDREEARGLQVEALTTYERLGLAQRVAQLGLLDAD